MIAVVVVLGATLTVAADEKKGSCKPTPPMPSLSQRFGAAYDATDQPALIDIKETQYLALTGIGEPSGAEFVRKVGVLFGVAYTIKAKCSFQGQDFGVAPLEALWWGAKNPHGFFDEPRETWNWKLLLPMPSFVTEKLVREAAAAMAATRGDIDTSGIRLERLAEGKCVQMLHVGPYSAEGKTVAAMTAFAKARGLVQSGYHHEIYLSDPQRTDPEQLRTILRWSVKPASD